MRRCILRRCHRGGSAVLARETVLVLDDEPLILIEIADALADAGAEVISAVRVDQAITAVELRAITAAVLDTRQPRKL